MDISPQGLARNWLPNLPHVLKTSALSLIGRSPNSSCQDTLTEAIVASARPILQTPSSLLRSQTNCNYDWGIGRCWISKYTIQQPSENELQLVHSSDSSLMCMRQAVKLAIEVLAKPEHHVASLECSIPLLVDVETEWTFYRPHTLPITPILDVSEQQLYSNYMQDVDPEGPTILHLHGGAYCLMDPSTHRWTLTSLAQYSRGRVLSVRYRLSPQNIFPAALLDALQAYLCLLSPPPGAYHSAVAPSKIVISGDSSGGGLASSLVLLLVTLARRKISIMFHGRAVEIPSTPCAGLALASPWLDLTRSLPSTIQNSRYDIIAPPPFDVATPPFPPDAIWPTSPPRAETFTYASMVTHPLVSPLAASSEQWSGVPPVYACCGWEGFTDEVEVFARRVHQSSPSAKITFEGWEGMPHCFMMVPWNRAGRDALRNWGNWCRDSVEKETNIEGTRTGTWTSSLTYRSRKVALDELGLNQEGSGYTRKTTLDDKTVDQMLEKGRAWRMELERKMKEDWESSPMKQVSNPVS